MSWDYRNVLHGGEMTDGLEKAQSLGKFCYSRFKKYGDRGYCQIQWKYWLKFVNKGWSKLLSQRIREAECLKKFGIEKGDRIELKFRWLSLSEQRYLTCTRRKKMLNKNFVISFHSKYKKTSYQPIYFKRVTKHQQFIEKKMFVFGNECDDE